MTDRATDGGTLLSQATYLYDALSNRLEKDVAAGGTLTVTRFAYDDAGNAWADLNGSSSLTTRRVYLDSVDSEAARISGSALSFYLPDRLGSIRNQTDASGVLSNTITYDGFGKVTSETSSSNGDRFKFTGRELDSETGLQYQHARYYDPATGTWTTADPSGFGEGDPNLYRYVQNSPTNLTDPTGLDPDQQGELFGDAGPFNLPDIIQNLPHRSDPDSLPVTVHGGIDNMPMYTTISRQDFLDAIQQFFGDADDAIAEPAHLPHDGELGNAWTIEIGGITDAPDSSAAAAGGGAGSAVGTPLFQQLAQNHMARVAAEAAGRPFTPPRGPDWLERWTNRFGGYADDWTGWFFGGTSALRKKLGIDAVDYESAEYFQGQVAASLHQMLIPFTAPCKLARGGQWAWRAWRAYEAGSTAYGIGNTGYKLLFDRGNLHWTDALPFAPLAGRGLRWLRGPCFAAGTPLLTPTGHKAIEEFQKDDWILSSPEDDPEAAPVARQVEEVFTAEARLWRVQVQGRAIRTTDEHPFWVVGKGWTAAKHLQPGDQLRSHDGQRVAVENVRDTGETAPVYNLRIAEYHTYFVGRREWGFSVWAHNACEGHHLLSQAKKLKRFFEKAGLDIEHFIVQMEKAAHRLKPNGLHTIRGGNWNRQWREFFKLFPKANDEQILDQLAHMLMGIARRAWK